MAAILVGMVLALLLIMMMTGQLAGTEYRAGEDRSENRTGRTGERTGLGGEVREQDWDHR
jgi:hypothetical protein